MALSNAGTSAVSSAPTRTDIRVYLLVEDLQQQFAAYLGPDESAWRAHDSSLLMAERGFDGEVLIDQGAQDQFLDKLMPESLATAMMTRRQPGMFRMQPGYDHSYFFVASFIADHIWWHAERLAE